ncbi:MAG: FHA domain-containing protein [Holophagales bacterium]|nr:FHA domain-containing protein [Holophagales bacterium]
MARSSLSPVDDTAPHRALLTVEENGVRHTFHLDGAVTIGREPGCDVLLTSPTASRRHALVAPNGEGWIVRDLGSGNGTFLDARRVDEAHLPSGVAIRFGSVPAWFEEEPEAPLTSSQRIQRTLTQTLSIQPAKRTRRRPASRAWRLGSSSSSAPRSGTVNATREEGPPRPLPTPPARPLSRRRPEAEIMRRPRGRSVV